MTESKKYLVRARELSTQVLGPRHHYVSAIINKVSKCVIANTTVEMILYMQLYIKLLEKISQFCSITCKYLLNIFF